MAQSFTGTFDQKVDTKNRMSIPADLRRVLEAGDPAFAQTQTARVAILYGPHLDEHLQAYTIDAFEKIARNIQRMKRGSLEQRRAAKLILSHSQKLDVDKDGRIVLPKLMRDKIGLDKDVQYSGMGEYFEIWNKAATEEETDDLEAWLRDQGEGFDPLSLVPDLDAGPAEE